MMKPSSTTTTRLDHRTLSCTKATNLFIVTFIQSPSMNVSPEPAGPKSTLSSEGWTPLGLLLGFRGAEGAHHPGQTRNGILDAKNSVLETAGVSAWR